MRDTGTDRRACACRVFCAAIFCYAFCAVVSLVYIFSIFGIGPAVSLGVILALPFLASVRVLSRKIASGREFFYLTVLVLCAISTAVFLVRAWRNAGMDRRHTEDIIFYQLKQAMQRDRAFNDVRPFVSGKHFFWLRGSVASKADLERLQALAGHYEVRVGIMVEVRSVRTE
jgi:hypothetical protein